MYTSCVRASASLSGLSYTLSSHACSQPSQEDPFLFAVYLSISLLLVLMAGLMSGLTLGLMSLDMVELEVRRPQHRDLMFACAVLYVSLWISLNHVCKRSWYRSANSQKESKTAEGRM